MEILTTVAEAKARLRPLGREGTSLGFVPTMGALHPGHMSLVERAARENDRVVVSVFVNPTQFNDPGDLERYPRPFERDRDLLEEAGVDFLFHPSYGELYGDDYRYKVSETPFSAELEGAHRPGHFDGVLTVVLKLLSAIGADSAYFGEKDWQQYVLLRDMAAAFFLDTRIVACPLIREPDGLAMSSRNALLTPEERSRAPRLHAILAGPGTPEDKERLLGKAGFRVDYVERREDRLLAAAFLGKVRLIDNVRIRE